MLEGQFHIPRLTSFEAGDTHISRCLFQHLKRWFNVVLYKWVFQWCTLIRCFCFWTFNFGGFLLFDVSEREVVS